MFVLVILPQLDEILAKKGLQIDKVINLKIDDKLLVRRVLGRYVGKGCFFAQGEEG